MHFERLTSADDPRFSAAMEGYAVSFPPHEQREPRLAARHHDGPGIPVQSHL